MLRRKTEAYNVLQQSCKESYICSTTYFLYIPYPVLDIFKGLLICDVVDEHDALRKTDNYMFYNKYNLREWFQKKVLLVQTNHHHCASVVRRCDCSEALLTSCIPETVQYMGTWELKYTICIKNSWWESNYRFSQCIQVRTENMKQLIYVDLIDINRTFHQ